LASLDERIECVRAVSLFCDLKDEREALRKLSESMEEKVYAPGDAMISEGETGCELFLLVSGKASVYKSTAEGDHYKVAVLDSAHHAFFGEGALLDSDARSATIKADTECHCLVLKRAGFDAFGEEHPQWALPVLHRIARAVMARLRKSNGDLMLLYNALVAEIRGR
jgi:CRP-like cAMP-binding protein